MNGLALWSFLGEAFTIGLREVAKFFGVHLLSGMIPAFFIAGAIAVFLEKERITRWLGPRAHPLVAYGTASFAGCILTVCSCGVLPIFTGILQRGAGIGPAFTFLFASPAINLMALTYTATNLGTAMAAGRVVSVLVGAVVIGIGMRIILGENPALTEVTVRYAAGSTPRADWQTIGFLAMLVGVMVTATGTLDRVAGFVSVFLPVSGLSPGVHALVARMFLLALEIGGVVYLARRWFHPDEVIQWLKKSWSLFLLIFPKVILGIFLSGALAGVLPLSRLVKFASDNSIIANLLTSLVGCTMYFGTIVGINIVTTLHDYGMHSGPALTLLLAGPAISLPSVLALLPIVGRKKTLVFLFLVVVITTASGYIFGKLT